VDSIGGMNVGFTGQYDDKESGRFGVIAGDWNTYGRIYFSGTARELIYTN
jgi:hypothetical protein